MYNIGLLLMRLFVVDHLKARVAGMITYIFHTGFFEVRDQLRDILTRQYTNDNLVLSIAMSISLYKDDPKIVAFIEEHSSNIKHMSFVESFLYA